MTKFKFLIFGVFILVVTITNSMTKVLIPINAQAKVFLNEEDYLNTIFTCLPLNVNCENTGIHSCTVQLNTIIGSDVTSTVYSDINCTVQLNNAIPKPAISTVSVYSLVEPVH